MAGFWGQMPGYTNSNSPSLTLRDAFHRVHLNNWLSLLRAFIQLRGGYLHTHVLSRIELAITNCWRAEQGGIKIHAPGNIATAVIGSRFACHGNEKRIDRPAAPAEKGNHISIDRRHKLAISDVARITTEILELLNCPIGVAGIQVGAAEAIRSPHQVLLEGPRLVAGLENMNVVGWEVVSVFAPDAGELGGQMARKWLQHLLPGVVDVADVLAVGGSLTGKGGSRDRGRCREGEGGETFREQHCGRERCWLGLVGV